MSAAETSAWLQHYPEWTPHQLDYADVTLVDVYNANMNRCPDNPATWFFGRTHTYADIDELVKKAAAGLRALGVRKGDRVAILLPNCPQHFVAFWAVQYIGATAVEHNPLYTTHELRGPFQNHEARVAIAWDKIASTVVGPLRADTPLETIISVNMIEEMPTLQRFALKLPIPKLKNLREQLSGPAPDTIAWSALLEMAQVPDHFPTEELVKDDVALILYTSGTTGKPKGAQLTHGNLYANILQGKAWVRGLGDQDERMLAALPGFHAYGLTFNFTLPMLVGGEVIFLPSPKIPLIMDVMKKHTPTFVPGVPTLYEKIIEAAEEQNITIDGIRASFCGAATLPVATVEKWESLTRGHLIEGYGLTETSPVIVGNPMNSDRRPGYVGIPFPDTQVRIANPENPSETMPDGEEGEVLVRGPQVFKGYLNNQEATDAAFHDGWFRTGDVGIMEPDGFIRLVARIKEVIITGGFNVYPAEVEEALRPHPDIQDLAVVGRPRSDGAEDVVACVTLREGAALDPEGLKEYARQRLTRYKVPRTFYHFEELARDQMGKIRRREVHEDLLKLLEDSK